MEKQYTFEEFVKIVETLRSEHGCPWDREQTHDSLRPCMMEEAAELLGAIRIYHETENAENMQEELGDILLQVVMHSVIAEEEKLFTMEDVITAISEKMIRRHPHVFTQSGADIRSWDEIKKQEKEGKTWITSPLREIPPELPSLTRGVKLAKKLDRLVQYYDPETKKSCIPTQEELGNVFVLQAQAIRDILQKKEEEEDADRQELSNAIARILRSICQVSYRTGLQPEQLLFDDIETIIAQNE